MIPIFIDAPKMSTEDRWSLVLDLLKPAASEMVLATIGAGPVEDLLSSDPEAVALLIELEAPRNRRLRLALRDTWQFRTPDDVFANVERLAEPDE